MKSARHLAVELIEKTFNDNGYSNIIMTNLIRIKQLIPLQECNFCSALYYGVVERKITLDYIISGLSSRPLDKLDSVVLNILRCGIYQILYMDSVPDNASVNESVKLAKEFKKTSASGMVNAVLRNFIRNGKKYKIPENETERMSVEYSVPVWLIESLTKDYGHELAEDFLSDSLGEPPFYIRLNNILVSEKDFLDSCEGKFEFEKSEYLPYCYKLAGKFKVGLMDSDMFYNGWFHVQDLASQLCCYALNPTENDTVLDLCSAPGGKTFTMAEMMNNKGRIYAFDIYHHRIRLVSSGSGKLGLGNITAKWGDATEYNPKIPKCTKILCDVPCSGIGTIRRKPEIKYNKNPEDLKQLPDIQYKIAENALNYLAEGGEMVYSTCTLRKAENEDVVNKLLANHSELELVTLPEPLGSKFGSMATLFPKYFGSDGFFIAKLRKIK